LLTLRDLFVFGRGHLVPREATSPYRYVEHVIEVALARKYAVRRVMEIGPGRDAVFNFLGPTDYASGMLVDYNPDVLDFCRKRYTGQPLEYLECDVEEPGHLAGLNRTWDYIVSNGVVEHLRNDVAHVKELHSVLADSGVLVCTTVLHKRMFNQWDHAVGHFRRYSERELLDLFSDFSEVQLIRSSMIQELIRPLFFRRIAHLTSNTVEQNNRLFGEGVENFSRPPYAGAFPVLRYLMPAYLAADWAQHRLVGGIVFVVARR
jgi:SAM-dependent methyltransferase